MPPTCECAPANVTYHKGHCRHEISRLAAKQGVGGGLVRHTYIPVVCRQLNSVRSKRVDEISLRLSRVKHRCLLNTDRRLGWPRRGCAFVWHTCIMHALVFMCTYAQLSMLSCENKRRMPSLCANYSHLFFPSVLCPFFPTQCGKMSFSFSDYSLFSQLFASFRRSWQLAFNSVY